MLTSNTPVVLVVEDDPPVRGLLSDVLADEGYQVVAVHDGQAALKVIESLRVDLVTLDLDLPGLSGSELLEVLRKRKAKLPPVVVVTSTKPIQRHIKQMAQSVITKPFDIDELLFAVLDLLPGRMPRAEAKVHQMAAREAAEELSTTSPNGPAARGDASLARAAGETVEATPEPGRPRSPRRSQADHDGADNGQPPTAR